jgi:hypothetical protein
MNDPEGVRVGHRLAKVLEDRYESPSIGGRVRALAEQGGQGAALDQLHGQERPAVGEHAEVVHGRDAGVLELPGDAGLVGEPPGCPGVGRVLLLQYLDGNLAAQHDVGGAVNDAHAAAGNLLAQPIPRGGVRHSRGHCDFSGALSGKWLVGCFRGIVGPRRVKQGVFGHGCPSPEVARQMGGSSNPLTGGMPGHGRGAELARDITAAPRGPCLGYPGRT